MNKENKITINNLVYALLFFVFGMILLTSTDDLISIASKVIGAVLMLVGTIKTIIYIYMKGKLGSYKLMELIIGLLIIGCGVVMFTYASALSFAIRTIIGLWVLFAGVNRIVLSLSIKSIDKTGFKVYFITSLVMILIGICLLSGLVDKVIGLFIIGYSITEIVNYIYFKTKNKDYMKKSNTKKEKTKKKYKRLKEPKVVDAIIEEEN